MPADRNNDQELKTHLRSLNDRWSACCERFGYDALWLSAGNAHFYFADDQGPPFKPSPWLTQWVDPAHITPGSGLLLQPGNKPQYFAYQPSDYWHSVPELPEGSETLEVTGFATIDALHGKLEELTANQSILFVGPPESSIAREGRNEHIDENPVPVLNYMNYYRSRKTEFELSCMREASRSAVRGHIAARDCFFADGSEFEIHMRYLEASQQTEPDLPYGNIVATNENASILHYQHQARYLPEIVHSLLIDAGGTSQGYAADITRTWVRDERVDPAFAGLLSLMEEHQQQLLRGIRPGISYVDLHRTMHESLSRLLVHVGLIKASTDETNDAGWSEMFCPHGLGHLIGLQTHDVGGYLTSDDGTARPPPENYPSLRLTREIEADQVFTIEPGIYFMPVFRDALKQAGAPVDWDLFDTLARCGGIRIEDNVRVLADGVENLTRDAFGAAEQDG